MSCKIHEFTLKLQSGFGRSCINRKKMLASLLILGLEYRIRYQLFLLYFNFLWIILGESNVLHRVPHCCGEKAEFLLWPMYTVSLSGAWCRKVFFVWKIISVLQRPRIVLCILSCVLPPFRLTSLGSCPTGSELDEPTW